MFPNVQAFSHADILGREKCIQSKAREIWIHVKLYLSINHFKNQVPHLFGNREISSYVILLHELSIYPQ